jgi:hypothetical protein
MSTTSLLSDEMLRQLIAVGQVDIAVGIPTLNHSGAIVEIVDAVTTCFRAHFPRERAVLVNVDGGSDDGTPELVLDPARDPRSAGGTGGLRTIHRISARYPGLVSRTKSVQVAFAANELVRARAMAVIDPDCTVSPDSVAALLRPVLDGATDFVTPVYARSWSEGSLLTQLLRPAVRGIYRRGPAEPAAGEWACSSRFATDELAGPLWDTDLGTAGVALWLTTTALAGQYETRQVVLGPRPTPLRAMRAPLPEVFAQVVGALFRSVELHEAFWSRPGEPTEVPTVGTPSPPHQPTDLPAVEPLVASFRSGVRDLHPLFKAILRSETWTAVHALAERSDAVPPFPDDLWARVVYEFAAAYHRGSMHRDHLIQALVTPYLGRTAAFLAAHATETPDRDPGAFDVLGLEFERARPDFLECWTIGGTP